MEHFHTGTGIFGEEYTQGIVDTQTRFDLTEVYNRQKVKSNGSYLKNDFDTCTDTDVTQIYKGDLVFMSLNKGRNNAGGGAGAKPVLSHLNGHYVKLDEKDKTRAIDDDERSHLLSKNIEFVGIATTKANGVAKKNSNNSRVVEGATVQIRGKNSILNTGDTRIVAGQRVLWEMPRKTNKIFNMRSDDRPSKKATLTTVPYKHYASELVEKLSDFGRAAQYTDGSGNPIPNPHKHLFDELKSELEDFYLFLVFLLTSDSDKFDDDFKKQAKESEVWKSIVETMVGTSGLGSTALVESKILARLLKALFRVIDDIDQRTIGIALSTADVGQKFDVIL